MHIKVTASLALNDDNLIGVAVKSNNVLPDAAAATADDDLERHYS
jgi:hypothetical protein